jgi:hypothetical protein
MPTKDNVAGLEKVLQAAEGLVEMKRLVDRAEVEVRTLKAQKDGIPPPNLPLVSAPTETAEPEPATPTDMIVVKSVSTS